METVLLLTKTKGFSAGAYEPMLRLAAADKLESAKKMRAEAAEGRLAAYSLLCFALDKYLAMELPKIETAEGGKPFFPDWPRLHFSLSHTKGYAACALGGRPLGVDVELYRQLREGLAKRVLSEAEYSEYEAAEDRKSRFFQLWTLKESYLKLSGQGITRPLSGLSFELGERPRLEGSDCVFRSYVTEEYLLSLAAEGGGLPERPELVSL